MSLQVFHVHTGASYKTNVDSYSSLDEFRSWISRKSSVQSPHQILMTGKGKPVKFQTLSSEPEVYLYDRGVLASSTSASKIFSARQDTFTPYHCPDLPQSTSGDATLSDLQDLSARRRDWARQVLSGVSHTIGSTRKYEREQSIINQGTAIAVNNVRQHLANLGPKFEETRTWAEQIASDQNHILSQWRPNYEKLADVGVSATFCRCLKEGGIALERTRKRGRSDEPTLQDYVDEGELGLVDAEAAELAGDFTARLKELGSTYSNIQSDSKTIISDYQKTTSMLDSDIADQASRLLEEIEVLSRKISTDFQHIESLMDDTKSRSQAIRIAQMHRDNIIPSIVQTVDEIAELGQQLLQQKQQTAKSSTQYLQGISSIESRVSSIHSRLAKLDIDPQAEELFNILDFVLKLPSMYGLFLVEYVRRSEWAHEIMSESTALKRDTSNSIVQETKRRAQWGKSMEGMMSFTELGNIGLAKSLAQTLPEHSHALAKRAEINTYVEQLSSINLFDKALQEVQGATKTLTQPPKRQGMLAKAFKNGSMHEAAFGRDSAVLPSNSQNIQELQREKTRVDEKLKSAESRIRKLEDLLHRQSQMPRPPSSSGFTLNHAPSFERQVTSPITNFTSALSKARDVGSRRSSTSSRRVSQNLDTEEKSLAQRIVGLEAELVAQREMSNGLKKDAKARSNAEETLKVQVKEAIATKEDLLGNMEAQQHEFEAERRLLKDENTGLNIRLEELEDEFDRVMNNNEQDNKLQVLQEEIDRVRSHAHELEVARHNDFNCHQDQITNLETTNQKKQHRNSELETTVTELQTLLHDREDAEVRQRKALRSILHHLSDDVDTPEDQDALAKTLENVAKASAAHHSTIQNMLDRLRTENASLESRLRSRNSEVNQLREEARHTQTKVTTLDEQILARTTEHSSLQTQFDSAIEDKDILQTMFKSSEGEVEALKGQLAEQKISHEDLQLRFASLQGFHGDLDDQMRERAEEITTLHQRNHDTMVYHSAQADRAEEVSRRLQLQIESLKKVLELVGLMILRHDNTMTIQKIPKNPATASIAFTDPSVSMRRSTSGPLPTKAELEALIETDGLHWATTGDSVRSAARYEDFMKSASDFDIEVFNEAIIKRVKDVEHIARKWQREAKAYRDKAHRAQSEAHERIALRSFKEGDLALFLPTRDQATKPWAAFNVGAPHYFLREQDSHKLAKRDWLIARISKVEERVVDLSQSMNGLTVPGALSDDNPYELSDGLRWYLVDAAEEKPGAPISIGTGKATVAMSKGEEPVKVSMGPRKPSDRNEASKTLARSLDSRRSSTNSRKSWVGNTTSAPAGLESMLKRSESNASKQTGEQASLEGREAERPEPSRIQEIQPAEIETAKTTTPSPPKVERARSPKKAVSPEKRKGKWDPIMSLDLNLESGKNKS